MSQNISGGFRQKWANNCSEYFERLVEIIQPKVIICLGRNVFDAVVRVAGLEPPRHKYNDTIQKGELILTFNDTTCVVFPMAHCGVFGTNNRNKGCNYRGLTLQKAIGGKSKITCNSTILCTLYFQNQKIPFDIFARNAKDIIANPN